MGIQHINQKSWCKNPYFLLKNKNLGSNKKN